MQPLRRVDLPAGVAGALWLHAMPGRFEPLAEFEAAAHAAGLGVIACLVPPQELAALSPAYAAAVREARLPFEWRSLPMHNFGLADDAADFRRAVERLAADLRDGRSVLLHCAAGIGRTGTTAACVLRCLGMDTAAALQAVRRAGSNPETAVQSGLIEAFAAPGGR